MMGRPWQVRPLDREKAAALSEALNIPSFLGMMLAVRGVTDPAEAVSVLGMEGSLPFDPLFAAGYGNSRFAGTAGHRRRRNDRGVRRLRPPTA